jgi:hypothetical protein
VRCKEKEIQLENDRKKGFEESERDSKEDEDKGMGRDKGWAAKDKKEERTKKRQS